MTDDIRCPYCGEMIMQEPEEGFEQDVTYEAECPWCHKNFVYTVSLMISIDAEKADCLNGSEHDFKLTHTIPRELSRMRCTMCDLERSLTPEEKQQLSQSVN